MKRQIFTLLTALVLTTGTLLMAQATPTPNPQVPPSQQVDQSGQPEQSGHPDVDVDAGRNADNGVLNVDVKRNGDSDTKAGNNPNGNALPSNNATDTTGTMGTTGTTGTTGSYNGTTSTSTTTTTGTNSTDTGMSDSRSLPSTASDMPLFGLLGALALAGALGLRQTR